MSELTKILEHVKKKIKLKSPKEKGIHSFITSNYDENNLTNVFLIRKIISKQLQDAIKNIRNKNIEESKNVINVLIKNSDKYFSKLKSDVYKERLTGFKANLNHILTLLDDNKIRDYEKDDKIYDGAFSSIDKLIQHIDYYL